MVDQREPAVVSAADGFRKRHLKGAEILLRNRALRRVLLADRLARGAAAVDDDQYVRARLRLGERTQREDARRSCDRQGGARAKRWKQDPQAYVVSHARRNDAFVISALSPRPRIREQV